ncbi:MAG: alpha/beta fold hydrolase [Sphingopyxis sp.]
MAMGGDAMIYGDFALKRAALSTGIALDYADIGPRDGDALIFLHGFPESHRTWRNQLVHLSDQYRCIAPDQRGYCQSDKPDGVDNYSADKLTADIFALADHLGIDRFTIVGHDWGGAIAWSVALNGMANGRVVRAIIANAPHPALFQRLLITNTDQRAASQYMRAFRDTAHDAMIESQGLAAFLTSVTKWQAADLMDDAERTRQMAAWAVPGAAIAMLNWYRAAQMIVPAMGDDVALPAFLNAPFPPLTIPTLVLWGMEDLALPPCNLDGLDALVTQLTVQPIAGAGHFTPWLAPDAVNNAMRAWLGAHPVAA